MTTIAATPVTLAELRTAREKARRELSQIHQINAAFKMGLPVFTQRGYSETDFQKFTDAMRRNPEYGPDPFPASLVHNKMAELVRLDKAVRVGETLLHKGEVS
jgi:hypothetical protein